MTRILADGNKKTVQHISEAGNIPYKYAFKVIKKLERAGLVKSNRGPKGGYTLLKDLNSFSLFDILKAVDEQFYVHQCLLNTSSCLHHTTECQCKVHHEFNRIQKRLIHELQAKSMKEILNV